MINNNNNQLKLLSLFQETKISYKILLKKKEQISNNHSSKNNSQPRKQVLSNSLRKIHQLSSR